MEISIQMPLKNKNVLINIIKYYVHYPEKNIHVNKKISMTKDENN